MSPVRMVLRQYRYLIDYSPCQRRTLQRSIIMANIYIKCCLETRGMSISIISIIFQYESLNGWKWHGPALHDAILIVGKPSFTPALACGQIGGHSR